MHTGVDRLQPCWGDGAHRGRQVTAMLGGWCTQGVDRLQPCWGGGGGWCTQGVDRLQFCLLFL